MKPGQALKVSVCACLSLAAGWGGRSLASRLRGGVMEQSTAHGVAKARSGGGAGSLAVRGGPSDEEIVQRGVGRLTTQALWDLVRNGGTVPQSEEDEAISQAIAQELLDREGPEAVVHGEALEDPERRVRWTHLLLRTLARKDLGKAIALFQGLPADCGTDKDRDETESAVLDAAAAISCDCLISTMDTLGADIAGTPPEDAEGFDFQKVADHLVEQAAREGKEVGVYGVIGDWVKRSPLAALDWLQAHPDLQKACLSSDDTGALELWLGIATSGGPDREEALLQMPQYYDATQRETFWRDLHGDRRVASLDPALVRAAVAMGSAEDYLLPCLHQDLNKEVQDPVWAQVPAEARDAMVAKFLSGWAEEDPSPNGEKVRQHWQASFDKACGR